jgi:hypothetical protein
VPTFRLKSYEQWDETSTKVDARFNPNQLFVSQYSEHVAEEKVTGPASYFPSIEKKYGKPISHWKSLLKKMKSAKHSEMVAMLKTEHEMGHGHANAIVAHYRTENGL